MSILSSLIISRLQVGALFICSRSPDLDHLARSVWEMGVSLHLLDFIQQPLRLCASASYALCVNFCVVLWSPPLLTSGRYIASLCAAYCSVFKVSSRYTSAGEQQANISAFEELPQESIKSLVSFESP